MSANSRLTVATHALAWMASNEHLGATSSTSEQIARSVKTNPVVIRRLMSEMVKAGIVVTDGGRGSGWRLARPMGEINLREIDAALGSESVFAMHRNEPSEVCPIAQGIRGALAPVYARVDDAIAAELEQTTLEAVLHDTVDF
jgi:DNA-binding IscR family transcriptional regulator